MQKTSFIVKSRAFTGTVSIIGLVIFLAWADVSVQVSSNSLLFNGYVLGKYISTYGRLAFTSGEWIFFRPDLGAIVRPWMHSDRNLKAICGLNDTLRTLNIRLLVVPVPDKAAIIQTYSPFSADRAGNQRKKFIDRLNKNNVEAIDLAPAFAGDNDKNLLYRKNDTHWDRHGISRAAEIVASRIAVQQTSRVVSEYFLKDSIVFSQGDLALLMHDSTWYPRKCTMVMTRDGRHYCDSPISDIMILGDSFVLADRQYSAGFGAWTAYFTKQPNFSCISLRSNEDGPRLLIEALKSRTYLPKVVIWVLASRFLVSKIEPY